MLKKIIQKRRKELAGMKGLLIKDIKLILKNKIMFITIILVAFILVVTTRDADIDHGFLIGYVTILCTMFAITTMSFDEQNNTLTFLMVLPVTRREYVREKYVLMFCCAVAGVILGGGVCCLFDHGYGLEIFLEAAAIFVAIVLLQLIMIPLQLKFGGENSRIVLIAMFGAFAGIAIVAQKISNPASAFGTEAISLVYRFAEWFFSLKVWMSFALVAALVLLCTTVSILISTRIMCHKEF